MTGSSSAVKLPTRSAPWVYVVILAMIAFMAWHYVPYLVNATLSRYDEFYTLDRTSSVLSHGDVLTIYANHVPSFNKPPLQYWLGAAFLKLGMPVDIALRAMPFTWALGTLALTGVLAAMLAPASAVAVIGAILFLSSSTLFWGSATSAMLDSGAGFFTVAAAVTFLAALARPRLCWLVAGVVGLGALQKAPVGLICILAAWFTLSRFSPQSLTLIRSKPYTRTRRWSMALTLVLILAWPVFQSALHGPTAFRAAIVREMKERFVPALPEDVSGLKLDWLKWMADDAAMLWLPALAMAIALPFVVRRPAAYLIAAWVTTFFLAMTFAQGDTYERYLLNIFPFLSVALAAGLAILIKRPMICVAVVAALWGGATGATLPEPKREPSTIDKFIPLLQRFQTGVRPEESLLFCDWTMANGVIYPGALSYYASAGKPFLLVRKLDDLTNGTVAPPFRGLCLDSNYAEIEDRLIDGAIVERWEDWVVWTARGITR